MENANSVEYLVNDNIKLTLSDSGLKINIKHADGRLGYLSTGF